MNSRQKRKRRHALRMSMKKTTRALRRFNHGLTAATDAVVKFNTIWENAGALA